MSTRSSKLVQSLWKTNWTTRTGCTRPVQGAARPMSPPRAEFLVSYREVRLSVFPSIEKNTSSARSRISSNTCAKRCPLQAGPLNATQNPLFVAAPHCDNDVLYFAPKCHRGRHAGTTACSLWSKIATAGTAACSLRHGLLRQGSLDSKCYRKTKTVAKRPTTHTLALCT